MISEFEQRLADVLGARLPAPFAGRVQVPPAPAPDASPVVLVGTRTFQALEPDLGSRRPEHAPGAATERRILRLRCTVSVEVQPGAGARAELMKGIDATLYALDAPDFRNGSALAGAADPGFLIQEMRITASLAAPDPKPASAPPLGVTLNAEGWFWPVGVVGEAGKAIIEIRVRGGVLPIEIAPAKPHLVAGGPPVILTLSVSTIGLLRLTKPPGALPPLPFGALALAIFGRGGRPGAGTLSGGQAGVAGVRLIDLTGGSATVAYAPPAVPATDELHVTLENGAGGLGIELGRFPIAVKGA